MAQPQYTRLCNFVPNISTIISALGQRTHLKLGELCSLFIVDNITIFWLYLLHSFWFFLLRDSVHTLFGFNTAAAALLPSLIKLMFFLTIFIGEGVFSSIMLFIVDYKQSFFFLSPLNKNAWECTHAWLKAQDEKGMKKERLPAQPQRMVFHGLLIFWHENSN